MPGPGGSAGRDALEVRVILSRPQQQSFLTRAQDGRGMHFGRELSRQILGEGVWGLGAWCPGRLGVRCPGSLTFATALDPWFPRLQFVSASTPSRLNARRLLGR